MQIRVVVHGSIVFVTAITFTIVPTQTLSKDGMKPREVQVKNDWPVTHRWFQWKNISKSCHIYLAYAISLEVVVSIISLL